MTRKNCLYVALLIALASAACKDDDSSDSSTGGGGSGASGMPKAVATIAGFMGGTISGTATFAQSGTDVTATIELKGCVDGKIYPTHIHAGTSCADAMAQGAHWGPTRGEGIPMIMCKGTTGTATLTRKATDTPELQWSIGGMDATNVVGHAFVVHNPDDAMQRIGCGLIQKQ